LSKSSGAGQAANSSNTDIDKKTKEIEDKLDKLYQKIQERKKLIQQLTAEVDAMG
jgi:prefoldin subunit 5